MDKQAMDGPSRTVGQSFFFFNVFLTLFPSYFIKPSFITVIGKPSAKLAKTLEEDETARIAAQVEKLGPEGLKDAEKLLEEAKAEHDKPIPTEILTAFPIPDVKSISWIPVQSLQETGKGRQSTPSKATPLADFIKSDGQDLPFFVQYDHVEVSFLFYTSSIIWV